ncbi:MAG: serine/threonine-protein kinase [Myxococcota bacterium]
MTDTATPPLSTTVSVGDRKRPGAPIAGGAPPREVGRYIIVEQLGAGGMGAVYTAYDPELDRRVALKVLHRAGSGATDSAGRTRLLREAQAIARVSHPNVVVVHDAGVAEVDGQLQVFLAMERIEGKTLRAWMTESPHDKAWRRGACVERALEVLVGAARGLAAAHAAGIIHRDFKPENVLLGDDGAVVVADFGLARRVGTDVVEPASAGSERVPVLDTRVTATGALLGTPAYMSPEQFRGDDLDARTDQFSFCATAFEVLFGVRPFEGDSTPAITISVLNGSIRETPSHPPVPDRVVAALRRGLAVEREDRFASMEDVLHALDLPRSRVPARVGWGAVGVLGIGTAAWAARAPEPVDPCDGGRARMAASWNDDARAGVTAALVDPAHPYTQQVADSALAGLQDYADAWRAAHRDACESTHVRHEQTDTMLDARMACLDRRLAGFDAAVEELASTETRAAQQAIQLVDALPTLSLCSDLAALKAAVPPPTDPEGRARVADARKKIDAASAKAGLHRFADALAMLEQTVEETTDLDYLPLRAELTAAIGNVQWRVDQEKESITTLREAIWLAQEAGLDEVVRDAAIDLATVVGAIDSDHEQALTWLRLAEATAKRIGLTPQMEASILRSRAWVLAEWQHSADAIDISLQALAVLDELPQRGAVQRLRVLSTLGGAYGRSGKLRDAESAFREARAGIVKVYGNRHPEMIGAQRNLGNTLAALNEIEEARECLEDAKTIALTVPNLPKGSLAGIHNSLGNLALGEHDPERAYTDLSEALRLREALYGTEHPLVARTLNSLALALKGMERYDEALEVFHRSLALREAEFGRDHVQMFTPLDNVGVVLLLLGRPADAVPYFERAFAVLAANPSAKRPYRHADHRYGFGRALYESGVDKARGHALVSDALRRFGDTGPESGVEKSQDWLATHPAP